MSQALSDYLYTDEAARVEALLKALPWDQSRHDRVEAKASELVNKVRASKRKSGEMEAFLQQYSLTTEEGLALMGMAEALLRIPDARTAKALIRDKVGSAEWTLDGSPADWMVKAAGLGMIITRKTLDSAIARLGEGVIRQAMLQAIRIMGNQFVVGQSIQDAMKNAKSYEKKGYRMSYDMLGEGARTQEDATRYYQAYVDAIKALAAKPKPEGQNKMPSISVKLSALHPRYRVSQEDRCVPVLVERLTELGKLAARHDIAMTVDAEEVDRLEISLKIIDAVAGHSELRDWDGFGLAIQAYSKRTLPLIDRLYTMAQSHRRRLGVRLVKGAYWDTEIKRAQIMGLPDYPVYTRKVNTDLSYLACAHRMLVERATFYPMLATHNAHSIAAILEMAGNKRDNFEFQRLHGMGEGLHDQVLEDGANVSVYAPVGTHQDLLPYLVRRLLENGANSNFVHQLLDPAVPAQKIVADPVEDAIRHPKKRHPRIARPVEIYGPARRNSIGLDLTDTATTEPLLRSMKETVDNKKWEAAPLLGGKIYRDGTPRDILNPANWHNKVGTVWYADHKAVERGFEHAKEGFKRWSRVPAEKRAESLDRLADLMEMNRAELMGLCVREAGKTVEDALAEIREAVDFCRYYAMRGRADFAGEGRHLVGPTGERNTLTMEGRGVFVCISPWNFPLAIFTGQITAALMAGNAVVAKPAEQTPLIAMRMARLILDAGVDADAFTLLPGDGDTGAMIVRHPDVAGVAFTGSTDVARMINRTLAEKDGPIVPLIAETGGQNAMIVDSSALPEQVIDDVLVSAFGSTGQRCSALRVLFLQDEIADKTLHMLKGAMENLRIGDPMFLSSDLGPVIDAEALENLVRHKAALDGFGKKIAEAPMDPDWSAQGHFFAPVAYEIDSLSDLKREVFGPVLHVIRYKAKELDQVIDSINATGYGLTLGVHSRIEATMEKIANDAHVGNAYINRTMIGAVVGVQPFGGHGLSGTGPKAGGPHYLQRFATEKVVSINTTASGGNASLVSLEE